jgi:hypothetical protein
MTSVAPVLDRDVYGCADINFPLPLDRHAICKSCRVHVIIEILIYIYYFYMQEMHMFQYVLILIFKNKLFEVAEFLCLIRSSVVSVDPIKK